MRAIRLSGRSDARRYIAPNLGRLNGWVLVVGTAPAISSICRTSGTLVEWYVNNTGKSVFPVARVQKILKQTRSAVTDTFCYLLEGIDDIWSRNCLRQRKRPSFLSQ